MRRTHIYAVRVLSFKRQNKNIVAKLQKEKTETAAILENAVIDKNQPKPPLMTVLHLVYLSFMNCSLLNP
jgi:hypothetical protein